MSVSIPSTLHPPLCLEAREPISGLRTAGNEESVSDGVTYRCLVIGERAVGYGIDCPPARQYFSFSPRLA